MSPGVLSYPPEFPFEIEPRSAKHIELVQQIEASSHAEESDAGLLDFARTE